MALGNDDNPGKKGLVDGFAEATKNLKAKEFELNDLTHKLYTGAQMRGSDDSAIAGLRINKSGRSNGGALAKERAKQDADDAMFLALLNQINDNLAWLDGQLEGQFGEYYAEDLIGKLQEDGVFEQSEIDQLLAIEDQKERRREIAMAIQGAIEDGNVDANNPSLSNPLIQQWLHEHQRKQWVMDRDARALEAGTMEIPDASQDGVKEAGERVLEKAPEMKSDFEFAADDKRNMAHENDLEADASLDSLDFSTGIDL